MMIYGVPSNMVLQYLVVNGNPVLYAYYRKEMYNITDAVLTTTLKDLIEDGIINRKSYDEIPPKVEYSLTQKGKSVVPILQSICQWSDVFYKEDGGNVRCYGTYVTFLYG